MNNAGGSKPNEALNYTAEDFSSIMALNFEAAYHLSQLAHPMLKASDEGNIILISSIASFFALNALSIYGPPQLEPRGVLIKPGATELTLTLSLAHSHAKFLASWFSAPLAGP